MVHYFLLAMQRDIYRIKDYNTKDTIAAIATFAAKSALGVIKISGRKAIDIVDKIFVAKNKKSLKESKTYTLHYGWIRDNKKVIDEVLVSVMKAPYSYTREDVVEISSHGGILVLNKILKLLLNKGARLAKNGEFTYRAFINGRIDLLKAESILNIVDAKTDKSLDFAINQLLGFASEKFKNIREDLKDLYSKTEALISFEEEELNISFKEIKNSLINIKEKIVKIIEDTEKTKVLKEGINCVICGKTNVGKSTLFNCLIREERAIVSEIPATTRDVIEDTIYINGVLFRVYDTAGFLDTRDIITNKAIKKSDEILKNADIIILVLDNSKPLDEHDYFLFEKIKNMPDKNIITVINKIDLERKIQLNSLEFKPIVYLSALKNIGIKKLEDVLFKNIYKREPIDGIFLSNYQIEILKKIKDILDESLKYIDRKESIDFVNLLLKEAFQEFGKITGEVLCEEVLENIFSNFCIGK